MNASTHSQSTRAAGKLAAWGLDVALLAFWLASAAVAFFFKHTQLFIGFDGAYMRDLARRQFEWDVPVLTTNIDLFQGVGDLFFSGLNFTLLPSFIAGSSLGATVAAKVVTYTIALAEITVSIVVFARTIELGRTEALAAALIMSLLVFPFYRTGAIYPILALVPHLATFIAVSLFIASAYIRFGRRGIRHDLPYAAIFLLLALWFVHAGILVLVIAGPSLLVAFVSGLFAAHDKRERRAKLGLAVSSIVIFCGAIAYLLGLLLNTAPITAPMELENDRLSLEFASILFHWSTRGPAGTIFVLVAILGALSSIFDHSRPTLRIFAIALLTYLTGRLSFWVATTQFDIWRGPAALYFEFYVYPLYAIFAVVLVARLVELVGLKLPYIPPHYVRTGLVATAAALALVFARITPSLTWGFPYPPAPTALTPFLEAELGVKPPAPFRGRVATLTGRAIDRGVSWIDVHRLDATVQRNFGNDMRLVGLHYFGLPGFFQYGSTITPAFYALTSRLLSDPRDRQLRSVSVLRRYEPTVLAMLGIRYVVTDAPLEGAMLESRVDAGPRALYLYAVPRPNLGDYSPTKVIPSGSATDTLVGMARPDFNPVREIFADIPGGADRLSQARDARLTFDGTGLTVTSVSDSRSVLLLPLEFSRCLAVTARSGEPVLLRANLLLTGLVFSGRVDATIALHTGPFINPTCRLRDLMDLLALGIRDVPTNIRLAR